MTVSEARRIHSAVCREDNKKLLIPGPSITQFIRGPQRHRRGVVVAFRNSTDSNKVYIGWSLCRVSKERFCPHIGKSKAIQNAVPLDKLLARISNKEAGKHVYVRVGYRGWGDHWQDIPTSIQNDVQTFAKRCYCYFYKEQQPATPVNMEGVDYNVNLDECTVPAKKSDYVPPSRSPSEIQRLMEEVEALIAEDERKDVINNEIESSQSSGSG